MKQAAREAKEGNATVLTAIINLAAKVAEQKHDSQASAIMQMVLDMRRSSLEKVTGDSGNQEQE